MRQAAFFSDNNYQLNFRKLFFTTDCTDFTDFSIDLRMKSLENFTDLRAVSGSLMPSGWGFQKESRLCNLQKSV
jgi:hypothetical protein